MEKLTALVANIGWFAGLVTSVCGALLAQADMIHDGFWRHAIVAMLIVSVAVTGYMTKHPWDGVTERRASRQEKRS